MTLGLKSHLKLLKNYYVTPRYYNSLIRNKPYNITTDASGFAIGSVLSQGKIGKDRPSAYVSRPLRDAELNYEVHKKEALAVIYSVQMFRSFVYGRNITIITDYQPLVWFKTADLNTHVQKWRFKLLLFINRVN